MSASSRYFGIIFASQRHPVDFLRPETGEGFGNLPEMRRNLEGCKTRGQKRLQRILCQRDAVLCLIDDAGNLSIFVISDTKYRQFDNRVMLIGCCFNLGATDILAAPDDDVFLAVNDE